MTDTTTIASISGVVIVSVTALVLNYRIFAHIVQQIDVIVAHLEETIRELHGEDGVQEIKATYSRKD
jgi:hypothetical protein